MCTVQNMANIFFIPMFNCQNAKKGMNPNKWDRDGNTQLFFFFIKQGIHQNYENLDVYLASISFQNLLLMYVQKYCII